MDVHISFREDTLLNPFGDGRPRVAVLTASVKEQKIEYCLPLNRSLSLKDHFVTAPPDKWAVLSGQVKLSQNWHHQYNLHQLLLKNPS